MDILKSLMGNKTILNSALGMLRNAFLKDGISAVFITPSDDPNGDTPGMSIRSFGEPVAILAGPELAEVQEYFRLKEESYTTDHFYFGIDKKLHQVPEVTDGLILPFADDEKEVDHV